MGVYIKGMKMPKECGKCRWFYFNGKTCTTPRYYLDSWCELMESGQDKRCGWVGKDISNLPGYGGYYSHKHCVEVGTRADNCPLVEVSEPHGDLIDRQKLLEDNKHLEYPTDEKYRRDRAWAVGFNSGARHCNEHAIYAKTVIEAEGE